MYIFKKKKKKRFLVFGLWFNVNLTPKLKIWTRKLEHGNILIGKQFFTLVFYLIHYFLFYITLPCLLPSYNLTIFTNKPTNRQFLQTDPIFASKFLSCSVCSVLKFPPPHRLLYHCSTHCYKIVTGSLVSLPGSGI